MKNTAATEQELPSPEVDLHIVSVQEAMGHRYGESIGYKVVRDAFLRAERAKSKYKLDKMGCFAFNNRDALLDMYQELVDALVYLTQYDMEIRMLKKESPFPPFFDISLLSMAMIVRQELEKQGDFE